MKQIIRLFLLTNLLRLAILEDFKDLSTSNLIDLAKDAFQLRPEDVFQSDIVLRLATRDTSLQIIDSNTEIDGNKSTKIIIHGWLENHKRTWYTNLTTEYLINGDFNIIQVEWERVARSSYITSAANTKLVGNYVGAFILMKNLTLNKVHMIGHSLGAHIAAFASKKIQEITDGKKIYRITALDPAGPYFREFFITKSNRLERNDAEIVDAIHTDSGFYGYENPIGSLDIYVNGGFREQPGCLSSVGKANSLGELVQNSFCSHARSIVYFIESINNGSFICNKCQNWTSFVLGQCNSNKNYVITAETVTKNITGICFANTNTAPPFLRI